MTSMRFIRKTVVTALAIFMGAGARVLHAFMSLNKIQIKSMICNESPTSHFMKRNKPSMRERRRQRAKSQSGFVIDRQLGEGVPPVSGDQKTVLVPTTISTTTAPDNDDSDLGETVAQASSLIESQRKSVEYLTYIRKRVEESFPVLEAVKTISDKGYFVHDGFLSSGEEEAFGDALLSQMLHEGVDMLSKDKLQRDITCLEDGEYVVNIVGGEAYADCPRLTEYVVSLTRHLPPLINKEINTCEAVHLSKLDATASMGTLRVYDRKTRLGAESLLMNPKVDDARSTQDRPYGVVCGDANGAEDDARRLTAMLFLSSKNWNPAISGGGITIENNGEMVGAIRDRLVLLSSETCSHRQEPWRGDDENGMEQSSCVTVHFVKEIQ